MSRVSNRQGPWRWVAWAVALLLLNVSLTFANLWPTIAIVPAWALSAELALCVLALVVWRHWQPAAAASIPRWLPWVWVGLVVGRYADVTSRSLYGRDVNLYWDLKLLPDVSAMFASVANLSLVLGVITGALLLPALLVIPMRWALGRLRECITEGPGTVALCTASCAILALGTVQAVGVVVPHAPTVTLPASVVYAHQAVKIVREASGIGRQPIPPAPPMTGAWDRVKGADVILVFLESYGAVSWTRPELSKGLAGARAELESTVRNTGRGVASAFVESTTFGGESWLAHISLMSGTRVQDQDTNVRLMADHQRDTMVKAFGRQGYRTVAVMPGLQRSWPEGRFYGFDQIYGTRELDYTGPPFGWWDLNDQFALARIDALEMRRDHRQPLFVFFPTISTHAPFTPAPPYQPDWARMLSPRPYDRPDLDRAWADTADWTDLAPSYITALKYATSTIGGYLQLQRDRDLVLIVIGDHQPPALVSGEGAAWDVPIHVVTQRRAILDALKGHGFVDGLTPSPPRIARMDTLLPILLNAFGGPSPTRSAD